MNLWVAGVHGAGFRDKFQDAGPRGRAQEGAGFTVQGLAAGHGCMRELVGMGQAAGVRAGEERVQLMNRAMVKGKAMMSGRQADGRGPTYTPT